MRTIDGRLARLRRRLLPLGFLLTLLAVQVAGSSPTFRMDAERLETAGGGVTGAVLLFRQA